MAKDGGINLAVAPRHQKSATEATKRFIERAKRTGEYRGRQPKPQAPKTPFMRSGEAMADLTAVMGYPPAVIPPIGRVHESPQDVEPHPPPMKGRPVIYRTHNGVEERRCAKCHEWQPLSGFRFRQDRGRVHNECKDCERIRRAEFYHRQLA